MIFSKLRPSNTCVYCSPPPAVPTVSHYTRTLCHPPRYCCTPLTCLFPVYHAFGRGRLRAREDCAAESRAAVTAVRDDGRDWVDALHVSGGGDAAAVQRKGQEHSSNRHSRRTHSSRVVRVRVKGCVRRVHTPEVAFRFRDGRRKERYTGTCTSRCFAVGVCFCCNSSGAMFTRPLFVCCSRMVVGGPC